MKKSKNKRTGVMVVILLGLLVLAYKVMFMPPEDLSFEENISAAVRVENILKEVESINFDTSAMEDQKFGTLKSIETPLISLPVGRKNPFSGIFGSN